MTTSDRKPPQENHESLRSPLSLTREICDEIMDFTGIEFLPNGLNHKIDEIIRLHQAEQPITPQITPPDPYPLHPSYEEQLALVESMMTCYDTPRTQAAGYVRDLLRAIIALQRPKRNSSEEAIAISLGVFDAGCLPLLLEQRIGDVERHIRINRDLFDNGTMDMQQKYLGQLQGCLKAVEAARKAYIGRPASTPIEGGQS
jgi:hypothetical protein